ncbi:glycogen-binding subunit 76A isoform X3 [Cloeon dipterum]|uniref:glycogen-binding subunit 76A isoform X3 n=1 Tax=Cloeon dipterum TaxID=197152 RepID=UPI00322015BD
MCFVLSDTLISSVHRYKTKESTSYIHLMAAERCGLGSLLPSGCRGRAETFARRLSNRLRSLGHGSGQYEEDSDGVPGQQPTDSPEFWQVRRTGSKEALVVSPPDSNNTDRFYDFDVVDQHSGASSPANEQDEIINESDGLTTECESGCVLASPTQVNGAEGDSEEEEASVYFEPAWGEVLADAFASLVPPEKRHQEVLAGSRKERKEQQQNGEQQQQNGNQHQDEDEDEDERAALVPQDGARTLDSAFSESEAGADEEEVEEEEEDEDAEEELCRMLVSPDAGRTLRKIEQEETPEEHSHEPALIQENGRLEITAEEREILEEKLCLRLESMEVSNKHVDSVLHEETLLVDSVSSPKVVLSRAETPEEAECALVACEASAGSPDDTQLDTPDETPRRVQRSSSLKTGKTPPGTPGRKKIVRFADVLGLDLADVRTFMDEIPKVPSCAYWDLKDAALDARSGLQEQANKVPNKCLFALFQQPCSSADFLDRLRTQRLCLENAYLNEMMSVTGTVRVLNIEFHKSVHVRYTLDNWENFADLQASYVSGSSDGFSDKFSFIVYANTLDIGQRLEFAVRYTTAGDVFWDNNNGANYAFQCLTPVNTESSDYLMSNLEVLDTPPPPEDSGWASFY